MASLDFPSTSQDRDPATNHRCQAARFSQAPRRPAPGIARNPGEGTQNLLCAYLAAGVLASLALNAALGLWWADPAVALAIAALAIKEGHQTWPGEGCSATGPVNGEDNTGCGTAAPGRG